MDELQLTGEAARLSHMSIVDGVSACPEFWDRFENLSRDEEMVWFGLLFGLVFSQTFMAPPGFEPEAWDTKDQGRGNGEVLPRPDDALLSGAVHVAGARAPPSCQARPDVRWFGRPFLMRQVVRSCRGRGARRLRSRLEGMSSSEIYHFIQESYERPSSCGESRSVLKDGAG
ncbi:hypothetical protein CEXT_225991 [Caerostris extrusa]|uniref:Uncharacterized protein n=1 Tax=Caerostris extrusa TaxID=172846 RepID=A0AAV4Y001_CAEEX|nr:hypothetical protein CEXT_225991 [Caerostris extrusa]